MRHKEILFAFILTITTILARAQVTPTFTWVKSFGAGGSDVSNSIAVDLAGNVYTTGTFSGTVDFDPGIGTYTLSSPSSDIFVCKLDPSGALVWVQQFTTSNLAVSNCIAVDALGNVYTTGYFLGTADFDPGPGTFGLSSTGGYDVFVSKLNSAGAFVWARKLGGPSYELGYSIAVDGSGNVYTTGTFQGGGDYDPGGGIFPLIPAGSADAFISKLDASGNFVWAQQFEASNTAVGNAITTDAPGNVYISGYFSGDADLDPGPGTYTYSSYGSTDIFVCKLNVSGGFTWAQRMGGIEGDWSTSVIVDGTGNVYTTGRFQDVVDFDPGVATYTFNSPGGWADIFISKLDPTGAFVWAKQLGGPNEDIAKSITLDVAGNVYTTGYFTGTGDFDPGAGVYNLSSAGGNEVFVNKLDPAGSFLWARKFGGTDADISQSIAVDTANNIYTTGYYWDTPDFDPNPGTHTITSTGANDIFVHKMIQCPIPASPILSPNNNLNICGGASATLNVVSAGTVNWFSGPTNTTVLGSGTTFITPTLALGTYTYYAEATTCTVNPVRTVIEITVTPLPAFSVSTSIAMLCMGQSATLTASGITNCTWTPGGIGTSVVVSPTVTTTYTASGSNGGCAKNVMLTQSVKDCDAIGILEIKNTETGFNIYPNPFTDKFTIVTPGGFGTRMEIFNSLGSLIYSGKIEKQATSVSLFETEINLTEQPCGIYFVKIKQDNSVGTFKIVKE